MDELSMPLRLLPSMAHMRGQIIMMAKFEKHLSNFKHGIPSNINELREINLGSTITTTYFCEHHTP